MVLLLDRGADIDQKDRVSYYHASIGMPCTSALSAGIMQCLLSDYELTSNTVNLQKGRTAVIHSACNGQTEMLIMLLDRGADINQEDKVSYYYSRMDVSCNCTKLV